jgi:hypothetical protein
MHQFGKSKFVKGISSFLSPDPVKIDKKTALKLDLAKKDEGKNEDELTLNHELPDISPRRSNSWNDDEEEEWVSTEGTVKAVLPPQSPERVRIRFLFWILVCFRKFLGFLFLST